MRAEKDPIYSAFCRSGAIKPFAEASTVIDAFEKAGLVLAIASGSYERDIMAILRANGLEHRFGVVVGKDNVKRTKPDPETYLVAAGRLGIPPERCLAIEDAEKGVRSAKDAGMSVILIETEITKDLELGGADLTLSSLAELRDLLRDLTCLKRSAGRLFEEALDRSPARRFHVRSRTSPSRYRPKRIRRKSSA